MTNINCPIIDAIEKLVSTAEGKKFLRTAELLRDASLIAHLEYRQQCTVDKSRKSNKTSRILQTTIVFHPPTRLMQ